MRSEEEAPRSLKARLLELFFPSKCVLCGALLAEGDAPVCPACAERYKPGKRALHPRGGEFFGSCVAALPYAGDVRQSLHRFKFGNKPFYAAAYGPMLADCVRLEHPGRSFLVSWAPVSAKRLRKRGYDQSRLLAEALAEALGMTCAPTLVKLRDTPPQSGLRDPARRRANVSGVYAAAPGAPVSGRAILLVDDVFTTGATLSECARTLLMAGAASVDCAALSAKM